MEVISFLKKCGSKREKCEQFHVYRVKLWILNIFA